MSPELSRTQKKKADHELQKLGQRLVELPPDTFDRIALPEAIGEAVALARRITRHGARRRQIKTVAALLRAEDPEPIRHVLDRIQQSEARRMVELRQIERWRDDLRIGDDAPLTEILERFQQADAQHLAKLTADARRERQALSGSRASRALFRHLRQLSGV